MAVQAERYAKPHKFGEERSPFGKGRPHEDDLRLPLSAFVGGELPRSMGNLVCGHEDAQHIARAAIISLPQVAGPDDDEQIVAGEGAEKLTPAPGVTSSERIVDRVAENAGNPRL